MRIRFFVACLTSLCLVFAYTTAHGADLAGRVNVPPVLLPSLTAASIETVFGVPLATVNPDSAFTLPRTDDLDILFLKSAATSSVVLMGYQYDDTVDLGIDSTAVAMLLMDNPANGTLDKAAKLKLITAYRQQPAYPAFVASVQKQIVSHNDFLTLNNPEMAQMMQAILRRVPQPEQTQASIDALLSPAMN